MSFNRIVGGFVFLSLFFGSQGSFGEMESQANCERECIASFKAPLISNENSFLNFLSLKADAKSEYVKVLVSEGVTDKENDWPVFFGTTKGYPKLKNDGIVNFSLTVPALTEQGILDFELTSLVSREFDILSIKGRKFEIPSNLSFPKQEERYLFVNIKLNKPKYRMFVSKNGFYRATSLYGSIPLKTIIRDFRSAKPLIDIFSNAKFLSSGSTDLVKIVDELSEIDVSVSEFSPDQKHSVQLPILSEKDSLFVMSLFRDGDHYFPQDFKKLRSSQSLSLKTNSKMKNFMLLLKTDFRKTRFSSILRHNYSAKNQRLINKNKSSCFSFCLERMGSGSRVRKEGDFYDVSKMSLIFKSTESSATSLDFLPYILPPKLAANQVQLFPPVASARMHPIETRVQLVEVVMLLHGKAASLIKKPVWNHVSKAWSKSITIPIAIIEEAKASGKNYQLDVSFVGHDGSSESSFTHLTKNFEEVSFDNSN